MPANIQSIYVSGARNSDLVRDLIETIDYIGGAATSQADADAVLRIDKESDERRIASVDSRGKARESELKYAVVYSLIKADGEILLDKESLLLSRDLITDGDEVIGRSNEADIIKRDMKRDASQQILRRVQALNVTTPSE